MMRRVLMLLLCLCLLGTCAIAEETRQPLSMEELLAWRDSVWQTMKSAELANDPLLTNDPEAADTWLYEVPFGIAVLTENTLDAEQNPLAEIEILTDEVACPRGIVVGSTLQAVLDAYPNANPELSGSASWAALYVDENEGWGWLLRHNQTAQGVEYIVSEADATLEGFYRELSLMYVVDAGQVVAIRASGFDDLVSAEEHEANLYTLHEIVAADTFSLQGQEGTASLRAKDLTYGGIDFTTASPEDCIEILGAPQEDTQEAQLRTLTYASALIESTQVDGKWRLSAILVMDGDLPGPKGLHIGDTLESVLERFGDADMEDGLMYRCEDADGNEYALSCSFYEGILTEYLLYRL